MSAFIVEKGTPGVIVGENIKRMGIRAASNVELAFVDCKIPAENLLGKEGKGYGISKIIVLTGDGKTVWKTNFFFPAYTVPVC